MGQGEDLAWFYRPVWIGILAVFALGPLALPLVWKSPLLGPTGRWIWTAIIAALTLYLVYSFQRALEAWKPLLGLPI